jgi:hypothetical protein
METHGSIPGRGRQFFFFFFATSYWPCGANSAPYTKGYRRPLPSRQSGRSVKLTTHLHLVSRLRMSWTLHLRPLYIFAVWCIDKGASLSVFLSYFKQVLRRHRAFCNLQRCSAGLRAGRSGFECRQGLGIFIFTSPHHPDRLCSPIQPPI